MRRWRCRFYRPRLVDHATDTHGDPQDPGLAHHLAGCQACRRDLAALREVPPLMQTSKTPDPGEEFWLRQRQAIGRAIRHLPEEPAGWGQVRRRADGQMRRWRYPLAVAASVTVALLIYRFAGQQPPVPGTPASSAVALDTGSLAALQELMQAVVVPADEYVPPVSADDEQVLAALPLDEAVGVGVQPDLPGAADLSDNELEGIDYLIGGVG